MKNALRPVRLQVYAVVIVSASEHWSLIEKQFPNSRPGMFRGRQFLSRNFGSRRVVFLRAGEDEIQAAAATQFGVDRWNPILMMTTAEEQDHSRLAISRVCEINGVRLLGDHVIAADIEQSVPTAIARASKEPEVQ